MSEWTEERVETLKKYWGDGLSGSQIAYRLGGVTRNAVIGKVHRLGLPSRATTSTVRTARARNSSSLGFRPTRVQFGQPKWPHLTKATKPVFAPVEQPTVALAIVPKIVEELDAPVALRVNLLDLREHMCRFPIGDPKDEAFHFCGRHKASGISYCDHHARQTFQPVARRKK